MGKRPIPDDWQEQDGYISVLFCIPNSRGWRASVTGLLNDLEYGRAWDEKTGNVNQVLVTAREILETMTMCDLETELGRIAQALENIEAYAVNFQNLPVTVANWPTCGICGQMSCSCNPEVSGPTQQEADITPTDCCPPTGFDTYALFETYACVVANWIIDKGIIFTEQLRILHNRFYYDYIAATATNRLSVTEVYQRMAIALTDILDQQWLFTVPNDDRASLITELTDRYVAFQQDVIDLVPEVQTLQQTIDHYWNDPFLAPRQLLETNSDTDKQNMYETVDTAEAIIVLGNLLALAAAQSTGYLPASLAAIYNILTTTGVVNNKFRKNTVIEPYVGDYVCTGSLCDCTRVTMLVGTDNGNENYSSAFSGGWDQVQVAYYLESQSPDVYCGPEMTVEVKNLTGYVPTGVGNDFQVIDQLGGFSYQGDTAWPSSIEGAKFIIRSNGAFTVDYIASEVC